MCKTFHTFVLFLPPRSGTNPYIKVLIFQTEWTRGIRLFRVITVSVNSAAFLQKKWPPALSTRGDYNNGNCSPLTSWLQGNLLYSYMYNSILKSVGCEINSHLGQSSLLTNTQQLPTANWQLHCCCSLLLLISTAAKSSTIYRNSDNPE